MSNQLVSVIIPVYNIEKFVKRAVESITNQTYKNLEIIVIDDASSDDTYQIVEDLAAEDNRIKLYRNEQNLNVAKTLNRALSLAQGDYIARMDGDDISAPDRIEKQVSFLESNPNYDLVGCSIITIDENGREISRRVRLADYDLLVKLLRYEQPVNHPAWLVRASVYTTLNGYRESRNEDYDFLLRMTSAGLKYTNLESYFGVTKTRRFGNTIDRCGLSHRKIEEYNYHLFVERQKNGTDSFSSKNLKKATTTSPFWNRIYQYSREFSSRAMVAKRQKRVIAMLIYKLLSLISPHKVVRRFRGIAVRLIVRRIIQRHKSANLAH